MGLLYSDLQVMGSLYVIRILPLPLTHLMGHLGADQLCPPLFWTAATPPSQGFPL